MAPRTPLGPKNPNARVQKKTKTSKIELSPHKRSVIEGMHRAGCSIQRISELENTPCATVYDTLKNFSTRPKGHSLPRSGRPPTLTRANKRAIIRFCRKNVKATYAEVKHELQLSCSISTICRVVRKQGIQKWLAKRRPILTKEAAKARFAWCREHLEWTLEQ